jgi:hypothetical protein
MKQITKYSMLNEKYVNHTNKVCVERLKNGTFVQP